MKLEVVVLSWLIGYIPFQVVFQQELGLEFQERELG